MNKIKKDGLSIKALGRILAMIVENYKATTVVVLLCIFGSTLITVKGTLFMQTLIDDYIIPLTGAADPDFGPLAAALVRLACMYLIGVGLAFAYNRIMVNVSQGTLKKLRIKLFTHMESLPIKYFDTHAHGDIMSVYTNDVDTLRQLISQSLPQIIQSIISIVTTFVSMLFLDIPLTMVTLAMTVVMLAATSKLGGKSGAYFAAQQRDLGSVNGYIEEMMSGQKVVKVFCHEEKKPGRLQGAQ